MKFGLFYEHQLPRPWADGDEQKLFQDALDQVELADKLGYDMLWEVEHHFLEEYSHSSAPEVFLAACSQRTKQIRLGHGIILHPPAYNHPARIVERVATLDLVSNGRVEWGTGESSSRMELEAFGIAPAEKKAMWEESVRESVRMMAMSPYPGYSGEHFSMPCRNLVPKPVQKPHPPLWVACSSRETIRHAARYGVGALTFAFVDPSEAKSWVEEYYEIFEKECVPIGRSVNPQVAMVAGFSCHEDEATAIARGLEGFRFFGFALRHFYVNGTHIPGQTSIWDVFQQSSKAPEEARGGIGTPEQVREHLARMETAGVDQVIFLQQAGRNRHEHICDSLTLFAERVMPEFKRRDAERERAKRGRLADAIRRAESRIPALEPAENPPALDAYPVLKQKQDANAEVPSLKDWAIAAERGKRTKS